MWVVIGILVGVAILGIVITTIYCASRSKGETNPDSLPSDRFEAYENPIWKKTEVEHRESLESLANIAQFMKVYNFIDLQYATDYFGSDSRIKGSVYRGKMNGELLAIEKMKGNESNDLTSLAKINHFNIIHVLGVCFNEGQWYRVSEYASNGPLSDWIFSKNVNQRFLSWTQRAQILLDVAKGLNYIHCYNSPPFVYKDVRSSEILLDSNYRAKISYFDPAKSTEGEKGLVPLEKKAYLSPEYCEKGQISTKLDVYAFGVLMLEVVTGKDACILCGKSNRDLSELLVGVIDEKKGKERVASLMDPSLKGNYPFEPVISVVKLTETCLKSDPLNRPDMEETVKHLSKVLSTSISWESTI